MEVRLDIVLRIIDDHYQQLFTVLAFTGARPNEILALRWSDIDFRRKEISITKGFVRGHEGPPKTASSQRIIVMLPRAEQAFREVRSKGVSSIRWLHIL
jgi:integrase